MIKSTCTLALTVLCALPLLSSAQTGSQEAMQEQIDRINAQAEQQRQTVNDIADSARDRYNEQETIPDNPLLPRPQTPRMHSEEPSNSTEGPSMDDKRLRPNEAREAARKPVKPQTEELALRPNEARELARQNKKQKPRSGDTSGE